MSHRPRRPLFDVSISFVMQIAIVSARSVWGDSIQFICLARKNVNVPWSVSPFQPTRERWIRVTFVSDVLS